MTIKVLMIDVDGVIVVHPEPHGWQANLQRDLGLARDILDAEFFSRTSTMLFVGVPRSGNVWRPCCERLRQT